MSMLNKLAAKAASNSAGELKMIPVEDLVPSERNFYRLCDIDTLADSIAANGLEQNLVVKADTNGKYRLVTGHRRLEAIRRLRNRGVNIDTVPCIVRPKESSALEMLRMIASNQYRELSDYEKMEQTQLALDAVKQLKADKVAKVGQVSMEGPVREIVSKLTGMSGPAVSKYAGIAENLENGLKEKMKLGLLPFTVAYSACKLPADWQRELLEQAGVAAITEQMVRAVVDGHTEKPEKNVQVEQKDRQEKPPTVVEPTAPAEPAPREKKTAPAEPGKPEKSTEPVESGRFGQLRSTLSGKPANLEDTAWNEHLVWRKEPPAEDVAAVVMVGYGKTFWNGHDEPQFGWWRAAEGKWYQDENCQLLFSAPVLGWFKIPEWEE